MKVIHVIWSLEFGGIERLVLDLSVEQCNRGYDVAVLVGKDVGRMGELYSASGIRIIDAGLTSGMDLGFFAKPEIKEELAAFDIAHVHIFSPALARLVIDSRIPIIFTDHGNYGLGRKRGWKDLLKFWLQKRFFLNWISYITFNSHFTHQLWKTYFNTTQVPAEVVYNGLDFSRYEVAPQNHIVIDGNSDNHLFVTGTTSRFAGFKRVDRLLQAFSQMQHREGCILLLVGDGPLRSNYENLSKSLGISNQVKFVGYKSNVSDYQAMMDVCVFPSCSEPFGLVALETLFLGKTTIVMRDGGGIVEVVEPIDPENVVDSIDDLAKRLDDCYLSWKRGGDDSDKSALRKGYACNFSVEVMADKFDAIYNSVLS